MENQKLAALYGKGSIAVVTLQAGIASCGEYFAFCQVVDLICSVLKTVGMPYILKFVVS